MHRISIAIQTHPKRSAMAAALQARLPGSELAVDPDPLGYPSPWRTYRHALELTPADATHRLVIQDDGDPCVNFLPAVEQVVAARPDDMIALFAGGHFADVVFKACRADETFCVLPGDNWIPAIAVVWPVAVIGPALAWVEQQRYPVQFRADDEIIGRAMRAVGRRVLATVPSLVEHPDVAESIVGKRRAWAGLNRDRVAACFIDGDPLEVVWA